MANHSIIRITKEIADLQKGPDLSLAVAFRDDNVRRVRALIIGPPDTPYEFGFFEFKIHFGKNYPTDPPTVTCITTGGGATRFNPNIYAQGKVCLSILGTWRGEPGEQWSSAQGLESILISIQSLMSMNPYENEPGFEDAKQEHERQEASKYAAKIRHETLRISVVQRLEKLLFSDDGVNNKSKSEPTFGGDDPHFNEESFDESDPFADLIKRRFLWYYESYLQSIKVERQKHGNNVRDLTKFQLTAFECESNGMQGAFKYRDLEAKIERIRLALDKETDGWIERGKTALKKESPNMLGLQNKFFAVRDELNRRQAQLEVDLVDKNPCVWRITLYGRPMTNLDGGMFNIKMMLSVDFPQEQPRVIVATPLFHQRVSPSGILCYFPKKAHDLSSHVQAIVEAIEDETPPYDPRTLVNIEASKLLWGTPVEKKEYDRKLRKSARDSTENM